MSLAIAIIIGIAFAALALWAVRQIAPPELQYPLRVVIVVAVVIWLIVLLWPVARGLVMP